MGWCSATEIMDAAVKGAEAVADRLLTTAAEVSGRTAADAREVATRLGVQDELDQVLSPFVAAIAKKLRDGDWDCIEESAYFDRFPQEMLGKDDRQYQAYLHEQLRYTDPNEPNYADLVGKLAALTARMEGANNGG